MVQMTKETQSNSTETNYKYNDISYQIEFIKNHLAMFSPEVREAMILDLMRQQPKLKTN